MKTLLALLLLIPSLSLGIDLDRKDIPLTKTELNYLYDYELGSIFNESQLTKNGLEVFNEKLIEDTDEPYFLLSGSTDKESDYYELKSNILNKDFYSITLSVNRKTLSIDRLYLFKDIIGEDIRNQLSRLLEILDLKEIDGVNLTTCEEFKSTVINAYRFKRGIKENLKDYYEYYISYESGKKKEITGITSSNLIKDKNNNLLEVYCQYYQYYSTSKKEREIASIFVLALSSKKHNELVDNLNPEFYDENEVIEIERSEFENLLSIFFELNTDGL